MASTTTRIKPIRIKNETADYFENQPLNRMVESLEELMKSGKIKFDGDNLVIKGLSQEKTDITDIVEMAELMRVPMNKLLSDFRELLEEGTLYYSDGRLINPRYEDFERICEKRKQDIDKTIANVVRQMGG